MSKTQLPRKLKTFSPKRMLGALVSVGVAFLLLMSAIDVVQKYIATRRRIRDLAEQAHSLQTKQATLVQTDAYLSTPEGAEQTLREKYNVIKPGEGMIVITDQTAAQQAPSQSRVGRWWDAILRGLGIRKR